MRQHTEQNMVRRGLQAAWLVAFGLMYLMSAAGAGPWGSCEVNPADGTRSECQDQRGPVSSAEPLVVVGNDTKFAGFLAFILPGARAYSKNSVPLQPLREAPGRAFHLAKSSGPPIYRLAPKNSDPSHLPA